MTARQLQDWRSLHASVPRGLFQWQLLFDGNRRGGTQRDLHGDPRCEAGLRHGRWRTVQDAGLFASRDYVRFTRPTVLAAPATTCVTASTAALPVDVRPGFRVSRISITFWRAAILICRGGTEQALDAERLVTDTDGQ